jgi:DNA-binding NarL/FixJ family response regulator
MTIRVLVADDQTLVRSGFRALLERADDIEVTGEAGDGAEAVERAFADRPDVVLMDVRMPGVDGLEATRRITSDRRLADVRVIVLTTFDLDDYVFAALHAGASGFLLKDVEPDELRDAVRVVARGDALLAPAVTRRLIREFVAQPGRHRPPPGQLEQLTEREREVMALVAGGLSNQERRPAGDQPGDGQDPREQDDDEAECARPGAAGRARLRDGPGPRAALALRP